MQFIRGGVNVNLGWDNCSNRQLEDNKHSLGPIDGGQPEVTVPSVRRAT
jgi:hypothetical protein